MDQDRQGRTNTAHPGLCLSLHSTSWLRCCRLQFGLLFGICGCGSMETHLAFGEDVAHIFMWGLKAGVPGSRVTSDSARPLRQAEGFRNGRAGRVFISVQSMMPGKHSPAFEEQKPFIDHGPHARTHATCKHSKRARRESKEASTEEFQY